MRRLVPAAAALAVVAGLVPARAGTGATSARPVDPWRLMASTFGSGYNPAYLGNGYLGTRVPAEGEGYSPSPVPTEAHVAGLYDQTADTRGVALPPGEVTAMPVAVPQWTGLEFDDGSGTWSTTTGTVTSYRQTLDLRTATLTTAVRWRGPGGRVTDLRYQVFVDRARLHVGVVELQVVPHWSGTARVTDVLGPGGDVRVAGARSVPLRQLSAAPDAATALNRYAATTQDGSAYVAETSHLLLPPDVSAQLTSATAAERNTVTATAHLRAGATYTFTKLAAIATSVDAADPQAVADAQTAGASSAGLDRLRQEHAAAWRDLWASRIDLLGDPTLARVVHASEFYLLSSFNRAVESSASPAGLSSDGYGGHVFWDTETWMYPALLAAHPDIAAAVDAYRQRLLPAARQYAAAGAYRGARFPWESAASGGEESPPPWSAFEQHISADIALAQWQYFLATGDRTWLSRRAYPLLAAVADYWVSRAVATTRGYELLAVMGPDEYNYPVDNSTYTNVAARTALRIAVRAAALLQRTAPPEWKRVADGLVVPFDSTLGIHPEYDGYRGGGIKQADTVMLTYPWEATEPRSAAVADLDYYMTRTDPGGPSMTDSVHAIDTLALHLPGCASYTLLRRSMDPFLRPPFDQFAETRSGGAFTFLTGTGGFLQEFYYGFSGLRWRADELFLDPALPPQLAGILLHRLHWHGRTFTVAIRPGTTTVTLDHGATVTVGTPAGVHRLVPGRELRLPTRSTNASGPADPLRCRQATATGTTADSYAFAANDGSSGTSWDAAAPVSTLTVRLAQARTLHTLTVRWAVTTPTWSTYVGPPIQTTSAVARPTSYDVLVSTDGRHWRTAASVSTASAAVDQVPLTAQPVRYVRLRCQVPSAGISLAELSGA